MVGSDFPKAPQNLIHAQSVNGDPKNGTKLKFIHEWVFLFGLVPCLWLVKGSQKEARHEQSHHS